VINAKFQFEDHSQAFKDKVIIFSDTMMALMATAIQSQIITSNKVPLLPKSTKWAQRGALRSSIRSHKLETGRYSVTAGENSPAAAYAAAQEAGMTRGHPMRKYSTPGTGPHWFEDAVETVKGRANEYAKTAEKAAGITEV